MQVVIGAGEVGTAIAEVLRRVYTVHLRDIAREPDNPASADVLHICFGHSKNFVDYVYQYRQEYKPRLVVIHSTVIRGTTAACGPNAVHSPVRGQHPYLTESLLTFTKFFAGPMAQDAADVFRACGVNPCCTPNPENTEAGKLWELTQYGINIAVEKAIHEYCEQYDLDFELVYTMFAETYNQGYQQLGASQYTRPVLRHVPGPIGGHCVQPGARLLDHPLSQLVLEAGVNELQPQEVTA